MQSIRFRDASTAGVLAKDWDISIEEREAEFRDDLREASGIGRRRKKVPRVAFQFTHLLSCISEGGRQDQRCLFKFALS